MKDNRRTPTGLIYICSAGHSGSTLLDLLLGAHTRIESLGEISHLPKNLSLNTDCCCGVPIKQCGVWKSVIRSLNTRLGIDIESNPYSLDLGFIRASVVIDKKQQTKWKALQRKFAFAIRYVELFYGLSAGVISQRLLLTGVKNKRVLYDVVAETTNVDWIVDSSKHYLEAVNQYKNDPENTRVILLVRDGRAVYYSGIKHGFSRKTSLSAWRNTYKRALPLIEKHIPKKHLIKIRYEDLASDTGAVLQTICSEVALDFEPGMLNFRDNTSHITNGNNMRFASSDIKLDTAWQQNLVGADLDYFISRARHLNGKLGYHCSTLPD